MHICQMISPYLFHSLYRRYPFTWYKYCPSTNTATRIISVIVRTTTSTSSCSLSNGSSTCTQYSYSDAVNQREIFQEIQTQAQSSIDLIHNNIRALPQQQEQQTINDDSNDTHEKQEVILSDAFSAVHGTLLNFRDILRRIYKRIESKHTRKYNIQRRSRIQYENLLIEEYRRNATLVYNAFEESVMTLQLEKNGILASYPSTKNRIFDIRNVMMELYGTFGMIGVVEEIFLRNVETTTEGTKGQTTDRVMDSLLLPNNHNTPESYRKLLVAYGKCSLQHRAEEIVQQLLHHLDSQTDIKVPVEIDIAMITALLNGIAEAPTPYVKTTTLTNGMQTSCHIPTSKDITAPTLSAWDRSTNLINYIKSSSYCQQNNIRPDIVTYTVLLKCLCNILRSTKMNDRDENDDNVGAKVDMILKEVEERYLVEGDETCQPSSELYGEAIKALLLANDYAHAKHLLRRMEEHSLSEDKSMDISPNTLIYNRFLAYYARIRSSDSAKRAESFLNHMRRISQQGAASGKMLEAKPDVLSYAIVMNLWIESNDLNTTTYLWSLYEQMTGDYDNLFPKYNTFIQLVDSLSSSKKMTDKRRTVQLLLQNNHKYLLSDDGTMYLTAIRNFMSQQDVSFTAEVVKMFVEAYLKNNNNGLFIEQRRSSRSIFNYVITSYIAKNDYTSPTVFLFYILQSATKVTTIKSNDDLATIDQRDVAWIGPDLKVALDLRKEWDNHPHLISEKKDIIMNQFDSFIIPTLVRFVNIEKENIAMTTSNSNIR